MPNFGNEVACPGCGALHVVSVGEIDPRRQIKFVCSSCNGTVTIELDGSRATFRPRKLSKVNICDAE
jgi:transposase-like protein